MNGYCGHYETHIRRLGSTTAALFWAIYFFFNLFSLFCCLLKMDQCKGIMNQNNNKDDSLRLIAR